MCSLSNEQTQKLHQQIAEAQKILNEWDEIINKQQNKLNTFCGNQNECCENKNKECCKEETKCEQTKRCCRKGCPLQNLCQAVKKLQDSVQQSRENHHQELIKEINIYSNTVDEKLRSFTSN